MRQHAVATRMRRRTLVSPVLRLVLATVIVMNNGCPTHGWSVIASASMDSQVAGVLAGFVFTSIVLLLGRRGPKNTQALGLFCAAFIALGFDSHLWGVISGGSPDPFCARVWSEAMTAAGLLAVGGMAIITGISWLLASHLDVTTGTGQLPGPAEVHSVIDLDRLVRLMAYGVACTVTLLLWATTFDYLSIVYPVHTPTFLTWSTLISPVFVGLTSAGIALVVPRLANRNTSVVRSNIANVALRVAAYGILAYAVGGPVFASVVAELGANWWRPPSQSLTAAAVTAGLALPALLMIALVLAVPPLAAKIAEGQWPHIDNGSAAELQNVGSSTDTES